MPMRAAPIVVATPPSSRGVVIAIGMVVVSLAAVVPIILLSRGARRAPVEDAQTENEKPRVAPVDAPAPTSMAPQPPAEDKGDDLSWDSVGGQPALLQAGGGEALLVRLRAIGKGDGLSIGVFNTSTLKPIWTAGPYCTYGEGYRFTRFASSGTHVVATDHRSVVHIYDRDTGKEERTATLTDRGERVCSLPDDKVWIEQLDKKKVIVDLASGAVREAPMPKACGVTEDHIYHSGWDGMIKKKVPVIPNFDPIRLLAGKSVTAVVGQKSPGTPTLLLAGVDPAKKSLLWQTPIPAADAVTVRDDPREAARISAVCSDRFIGTYGVGQKQWHVTAFDTSSGTRQWDVVLKPIFSVDRLANVVCSDARVFVGRMDSIDVLDANTGKAVGTIGHETYEDENGHVIH